MTRRRAAAARRRPPARLLRVLDHALVRAGTGASVVLALGALLLTVGVVGAVFSATSAGPPSSLATADLDAFRPTTVSATRTTATTCLVTWTPASGAPAGLTYDVTDGTSTVVTGTAATSATVTVPASAVTVAVRARTGTWISAQTTTASCVGWPSAPGGLTLTASTGAVAASWTAPDGNGATVTGYTATIGPAPGTGSATCTVSTPTTTCSWSGLTDGVTYTVSVTATSSAGTGPATTATAVPYPSTILTAATTALWLDGADPASVLAASDCSAGAATASVGCWRDRSGNGRHATQPASGQRPATTTVAGRTVPAFDGLDDSLALDASGLPAGTSDSTALVVAALTDPARSG